MSWGETFNVGGRVAAPSPAPSGDITPSVSMSRTSGVAPLGVFFDATATDASAYTSRPFHDLEFRWDFGDETVSTWQTGILPGTFLKNVAHGPVASHIYEPTTTTVYTPSLQVRYRLGDGSFDSTTYTLPSITVTPADTQWAGTKTVVISTSGTFTGAPSGATQITSSASAQSLLATHLAGGDKRVLFNRGEVWDISSVAEITTAGLLIGAYGTGAKPVLKSTMNTANSAMIRVSTNATPTGVSDIRLVDLEINGITSGDSLNNCSTGLSGGGSFSKLTLLRIDFKNMYYCVNMSGSILDSNNSSVPFTHAMWDEFFLEDCTSFQLATLVSGPNAMFIDCRRASVKGFAVDNNDGGEHGIRFQLLDRGVLSYNEISNTASGKTNMTVRGRLWTGTNTVAAGGYSEKIVISGNKFVGGVGFGPQNQGTDERGRNLIYERNWSNLDPSKAQAFGVNQTDVTIRNNLVHVSGTLGGGVFYVKPEDVNAVNIPTRVNVYNNTVAYTGTTGYARLFTSTSNNGSSLIGSTFDVRNNVFYGPNVSGWGVTGQLGSSAATITESNNTTNKTTDPGFATNPPTAVAHFTLGGGGYAAGAGTGVPVCSDLYYTNTQTTPDMGAIVI